MNDFNDLFNILALDAVQDGVKEPNRRDKEIFIGKGSSDAILQTFNPSFYGLKFLFNHLLIDKFFLNK